MKKKKFCFLCKKELRLRFWLIPSKAVCPNCGTVFYTRRGLKRNHEIYDCHFSTDDWEAKMLEGYAENV